MNEKEKGPRLARTFADAFVQANKELGSGLEVNTTKTEVYPATEEAAKYFGATSNDAEARGNAWQDVKMVPAVSGVCLVGSPVGSQSYCTTFWNKEVEDTSVPLLELVAKVPLVQDRLLLTRYCGVSRAGFMMRSTDPAATEEAAHLHDGAIQKVLQSMLPNSANGSITNRMMKQAELPLNQGGLGLTAAVGSGMRAYPAAFADAARNLTLEGAKTEGELPTALKNFYHAKPQISNSGIVQDQPLASGQLPPGQTGSIASLLDEFASYTTQRVRDMSDLPTGKILTEDDLKDIPSTFEGLCATPKHLQHRLNNIAHKLDAASLRHKAPAETAARLLAVSQEGAPAIFRAIPSDDSLRVSNDAMSHHIAVTLGSPDTESYFASLAAKCPTCTQYNQTKSLLSNHVFNCKCGGGPIFRHDRHRDIWAKMLRKAGHQVHVEPRSTLIDSGQGGPDLKVVLNDGSRLLIEVVVTNPLNNDIVTAAAKTPLIAAKKAEARKEEKFQRIAEANNMDLHIAALETTGGLGAQSKNLLRSISKKWTAANPHTPIPSAANIPKPTTWAAPSFEAYWKQVMSIEWVRSAYHMAKTIIGNNTVHVARNHRYGVDPSDELGTTQISLNADNLVASVDPTTQFTNVLQASSQQTLIHVDSSKHSVGHSPSNVAATTQMFNSTPDPQEHSGM